MNAPKVRTAVTFALIFLAFIALAFLATVATRSRFPGQPLAGGNYGADDFNLNDEELNAQLDDLVDQKDKVAPVVPEKAAPSKK